MLRTSHTVGVRERGGDKGSRCVVHEICVCKGGGGEEGGRELKAVHFVIVFLCRVNLVASDEAERNKGTVLLKRLVELTPYDAEIFIYLAEVRAHTYARTYTFTASSVLSNFFSQFLLANGSEQP